MSITMQEMARLAGVSRQAVSAVLNHPDSCRIPDHTQKRILEIAAKHGFVPNAMARLLKGASAHMIGFVGSAPYFGAQTSLFRELVHLFRSKGFDITFRITDHEPYDPLTFIREFEMKGLDGIVVLDSQVDPTMFSVPHITVNSEYGYDIGCPRSTGAYMATEHLIGHGRKRIAFLHIVKGRLPARVEGWEKACRELLGGRDEQLELCGADFDWNFDTLATRLRQLNVDGIYAQNDFVAGRTVMELLRRGIRVPEDIAVIGSDGMSFCDFCQVPLASVITPVRQQAELAVKLLLDRIQNKVIQAELARIEVAPILYTNSSCGCPEHAGTPFYRVNTFQAIELDRFANNQQDITKSI